MNLPPQPAECGQRVPHAALAVGLEARTALKRERAQLEVANDRIADCFAYNDSVRKGLR